MKVQRGSETKVIQPTNDLAWILIQVCLSPKSLPFHLLYYLVRRFYHPSSLDHSFLATPTSVMFLKHATLSSIPRPLHLLSPLLGTLFNQIFVKLLINYVSAQDAICPEQPFLSILSRLALKSLSHNIHHHLIISCLFAYYIPLST